MKTIKHILLGFLVLLVLALALGVFLLHKVKTAAIPDYNKNIELPGLSAEVKIYRDTHGVPHIYAETETDLYYAVGYAMA